MTLYRDDTPMENSPLARPNSLPEEATDGLGLSLDQRQRLANVALIGAEGPTDTPHYCSAVGEPADLAQVRAMLKALDEVDQRADEDEEYDSDFDDSHEWMATRNTRIRVGSDFQCPPGIVTVMDRGEEEERDDGG
eukprot:GHVH01010664.1.p2 GENE.GHVH01010664.1~~GHVH01010664.1.p2  ORF type:complete len:136 (+),score=30.09 GHVH01010664.1:32-439(+)